MTSSTMELVTTSGAELDQLFTTSPVGQAPDGRGRGTVLFGWGGGAATAASRLAHLLFWQGKVVDRANGELRNLITPFGIKAIRAQVRPEDSWIDERPCTVLDYSRTSRVAHWIRDEIREVSPGVYLGQVFWGRRRVLRFALDFTADGS